MKNHNKYRAIVYLRDRQVDLDAASAREGWEFIAFAAFTVFTTFFTVLALWFVA